LAAAPPIAWSVSLGAETLLGPLPAITGAGTLGIALQTSFLTVGLEARASGPAVLEVPLRGTTVAFLVAGNVVPCIRGSAFEACAVGSFGTLRALGREVGVPAAETIFYAAAGIRAAPLVAINRSLLLRPYVEIVSPITQLTLALRGKEIWTAPPACAILGVSTTISLKAP
jgi:hypothetical protein